MSEDWASIAAEVAGGIAEVGMTAAIRRQTLGGPSYDPSITITDHACELVVLDIDLSKIDGTLIELADKMAYVSTAGLTIEPTTADKIVIAGKEHAIKNVKPLAPAGVTVYWEIIFVS